MTHLTEMGQLVDLITAPEDEVDLSKFSLDKYVPSISVLDIPLAC
jgi:farnesyl diphosphate synthase